MEKSEIAAKIMEIGTRGLGAMGLEIVHVELQRQGSGWFLRFFIDKPTGVTLDDCQRASRQLSAELDVEDIIPGRYILEVSSPGLDRPLRTDEDFRRFAGKLAAIQTHLPIQGRRHFVGRLQALEGSVVTIVDAEGNPWAIPKSNISKARLEVEF